MRERNHKNSQATGSRDYRILVLLVAGFLVGVSSFIKMQDNLVSGPSRQSQEAAISATALLSSLPLSTDLRPLIFLPVPLNSADRRLLETIPGIGPKLAERILNLRKARNGFRELNELLDVEGIGPQKFAAIKNYCCL